jgi:hypothetical protein
LIARDSSQFGKILTANYTSISSKKAGKGAAAKPHFRQDSPTPPEKKIFSISGTFLPPSATNRAAVQFDPGGNPI